MKSSWLKYLGFLGLLGLLGLVTRNVSMSGFFGFFAYNRSVADERFDANVNKAARNAFILSAVTFALTTVYAALTEDMGRVFALGFALSFALQIAVFAGSLAYFEKRGDGV